MPSEPSKPSLISVIMPVYNVERYVRKAAESVLRQTYPHLELIVVNDGSTDGSPAICDELAAQDSRVRVVHQQNGGPSNARNAAIFLARGEFLYFLDSDDWLREDALDILVQRMRETAAELLFFDSAIVDENNTPDRLKHNYIRSRCYGMQDGPRMMGELNRDNAFSVSVPFLFIHKSFLDAIGLRFYDGILHEDVLFTFQLFVHASRVAHVQESLYFRRIRAQSIMTLPKTALHASGVFTACIQSLQAASPALKDAALYPIVAEHLARIFIGAMAVYHQLPAKDKREVAPQKDAMVAQVKKMGCFQQKKVALLCWNSRFFFALRTVYGWMQLLRTRAR